MQQVWGKGKACVYRFLLGEHEGKSPFGRHIRRWEKHIEKDLQKIYDERVDRIYLAQDDDRWPGSC